MHGIRSRQIVVKLILPCALLFIFCSCATYHQQNSGFNTAFENGELKNALSALQTRSSNESGRNRFIYYINNGLLLSVMGKYEESNEYFEKAFLFGEDYHINYLNEAASYFSNPMVTVYRGEDHEHLMLLYFKALNYLKLNKPDEALVECRRVDIRLKQLGDKYKSETKFQRDAFIHVLMGIIYQSTKDYNNAFIAYRNAVEIYETDYQQMFGMTVPEQLKKDLLNTAAWVGFTEEFESYKTKFGMLEYVPSSPDAELVFFWHNGLTPVKGEWSVNFVIDHSGPDLVVFRNDELNFAFPYHIQEDKDKKDKNNPLADLEFFRVAFPKYIERTPYYHAANLTIDSVSYGLEPVEDISKIAFYSLEQRMVLEFSKGLLRAALKKASEQSIRKENDQLGALIGLVNAVTEKADTRNWQSLPHSIYYSRVPLKVGENKIGFHLKGANDGGDYNFTYKVDKGQTLFHTFSSLETTVHPYRMSSVTD
jgi:uncharacterized protein